MDLTEGMALVLETAYFRDGAKTRTIADYIGTEKLTLRTGRNGTLAVVQHVPLPGRPKGQIPVTAVFPEKERRRRQQRLYFQVVVNKASGKANAVVLSAGGSKEMAALTAQLMGKAVCAAGCTVIPEGSSVSLAMEIFVNGEARTVLWGSNVNSVLGTQRPFTLRRGEKVMPPGPSQGLLPGDRIEFQ